MFCGGNTLLPNGDLLFAGGRRGMRIDADQRGRRYDRRQPEPRIPMILRAGTVFTSSSGIRFESIAKTVIPA